MASTDETVDPLVAAIHDLSSTRGQVSDVEEDVPMLTS
jgi:hypothetical protein